MVSIVYFFIIKPKFWEVDNYTTYEKLNNIEEEEEENKYIVLLCITASVLINAYWNQVIEENLITVRTSNEGSLWWAVFGFTSTCICSTFVC